MLKLLQYLVLGHYRQYQIIKEINIIQDGNVVGTKWISQCKHCGNLKEFKSEEK